MARDWGGGGLPEDVRALNLNRPLGLATMAMSVESAHVGYA